MHLSNSSYIRDWIWIIFVAWRLNKVLPQCELFIPNTPVYQKSIFPSLPFVSYQIEFISSHFSSYEILGFNLSIDGETSFLYVFFFIRRMNGIEFEAQSIALKTWEAGIYIYIYIYIYKRLEFVNVRICSFERVIYGQLADYTQRNLFEILLNQREIRL